MTPYTGIFLQSDASLYVKVPAPATDLKIARAKLLYMLIKHRGVPVKGEEWTYVAAFLGGVVGGDIT